MDLEHSIKDCCGRLGSVRASDRKKSADQLKEFLSHTAVPALLTKNSLKKNGFCWNNVFDDINDYVLKETEKFETTKSFTTVVKPLCSSVLHLCISGSIKSKTYIKCDKIIDMCLFVLKDARLNKAVGDIYLNLLNKHVLSCEYYLSCIKPEAWEDLLNICLSVCNSKDCELDDFSQLKLLWAIVRHASYNCQFTTPLRNSLPKVKSYFVKTMDDKKVQDTVMDIVILVLKTLSSECRLTICEFTESLLSSVMKFYDQSWDPKKKASLFKLLHLSLQLHHPRGALRNEAASLANDWNTWSRQTNSILEIVCLECKAASKINRLNYSGVKYLEDYCNMAAAVYYQVINTPTPTEEDEGHSSKRRRLSYNKNKTFSDLIEEFKHNQFPWLEIINKYVKNYGQTITKENYHKMIVVINSLLLKNEKNLNWSDLKELTRLCVKYLTLDCKVLEENAYKENLFTLWNSCARTSTLTNEGHKTVHSIMQCLLDVGFLKLINIHPLIKLYDDRGMPVTDDSVRTLMRIYYNFFSHCGHQEERIKILRWLTKDNIPSVSMELVHEILLRLLSSENVNVHKSVELISEWESLREALFNSIENSILFSEFHLEIFKQSSNKDDSQEVTPKELQPDLNNKMNEYLRDTVSVCIEKMKSHEIDVLEFIKILKVTLAYLDVLVKHNFATSSSMEDTQLYHLLKNGLRIMYLSAVNDLKNKEIQDKVFILKSVEDLLSMDYMPMLGSAVRGTIHEDFFHCINSLINIDASCDEIDSEYDENYMEMNSYVLRQHCIRLLATYCIGPGAYREEVLSLILNPTLYNFAVPYDIEAAFYCIESLSQTVIADATLVPIFQIMQKMCKDLFRNTKVSFRILKNLSQFLEKLWIYDDSMKQNCFIMIKGYLLRCETLHYPPYMAALIYECAVKMSFFNSKYPGVDDDFLEIIIKKVKHDTYSIRLYCCYLLKQKFEQFSIKDIESYLDGLMDLFVIKVAERRESILKDEMSNRTLTLLHSVFAITQIKTASLYLVLPEVIRIQQEKNLDEKLIQIILNKITRTVIKQDLDKFFNTNILFILNYWFSKNKTVEELPLSYFGFANMNRFVQTHLSRLVPLETLWGKKSLRNTFSMKYAQAKLGKSEEDIIEASLSYILVLCLPYIVVDKYRMSYIIPGNIEWSRNATLLFDTARDIIGAEQWSSLFADNLGELILMSATHLSDHIAVKKNFQMDIPFENKSFQFPTEVFSAILRYIGELIEGNIMLHLCEHTPLIVLKVLFSLWERFLNQSIYEYKILSLHSFLTFLENIPFGYSTDVFVYDFVCSSLGHAINKSQCKKEIGVLLKVLKELLERYNNEKSDIFGKSLFQILSVLTTKKEKGYDECSSLINYLTEKSKDALRGNEDVVDFVSTISQNDASRMCATKEEFEEKLKSFNKNLLSPCLEALQNLQNFLRHNNIYVKTLEADSCVTGFSDDCAKSILHQVIHNLNKILKTSFDDKITIEACNCLIRLGNFDLKTFVTFTPSDTKKVSDLPPSQYFAISVLKTLSSVLFSEDPTVTRLTVNTLKNVLRYQEAKHALESGDVDSEILSPFSAIEGDTFAEFKINDEKFQSMITSRVWVLHEEHKFSDWLTQITVNVLDVLSSTNNYLGTLRDVCYVKLKVCEALLPSLVGLFIESSSEKHLKKLCMLFNMFFTNIWEKKFHAPQDSEESYVQSNSSHTLNHDHKNIIQSMLEIVDIIRLQKKHYPMRPESSVHTLNYLKLEYEKVSWAAALVGRHIDAVYYAELWAVTVNGGVPPECPDTTAQLQGGEHVQRILRKCFTSIGETDALDGCGIAHLTNENEKRKHLIKSGQYNDALLLHDVALSSCGLAPAALQHGIIKCLQKSGMHHLALQYMRSMTECDKYNDVKYDCLSYLGDWSEIVDTRELDDIPRRNWHKPSFVIKAYRYACLKDCLVVQTSPNSDKLVKSLNKAKLAVAGLCENLNMSHCQNIYKILENLHLFGDVEDYHGVLCNEVSIHELLSHWQVNKLPAFKDFKHLEPIITQRGLILEHAAKTHNNLSKDIVSLQLQYVELSLSNKRVEIAQRLLSTVKKITECDELALAESQISWARGHRDIALSLLRNIVNNPSEPNLAAISLRQYGVWMAESKLENTKEIINKYLMQSLDMLQENDYNESKLKVYHDIAKFAYAEYKQLVVYMNSKIFENKVRCLESMKDTVDTWRPTQQSLNNDERKALLANDKFGKIDEAEIANTRAEKEYFLGLAMRYYLRSLKYCEDNNLSIFRVISLWLDNQSIELTDSDEETFEDLLHSIPSRKFITVLPQLGPRLTNESCEFADNLKKIIKRCAKDHPHHTLPILFSLRNSDKDEVILNACAALGDATPKQQRCQEPRVLAAENIVNDLATEDPSLTVVIAQMNMLCDATISFANYLPKTKDSKQKIPAVETIHKLSNLDAVPVPIDNISISHECDYSNIPTLYSFENFFELVGGINCPKKITCRLSDGRSKTLLIKGKDDLRQDAMMQQVFNIVNTLLEKDSVTSRNKLSIRTYKVVPMSRRSGMLEWCEGTMPIGSYLIGSNGAHARFRPQDISYNAARQKLTVLYEKKRPNQEKLTAFLKIIAEFRPAFHYFFIEYYVNPVTWYERRLAYTKSVATSSMVGYIMGLGDRHLQNILIDKRTAEVIHIDFGIAFDQGKTLPTPETVPFRLTQDIIAGFGTNGVEGIFRRSCEKTMQLLRENQETLLTILEVLLCDPLYSWTVISNQQKVRGVLRDTTMLQSSSEGSLAKRALLAVSSKLSGTEGGVPCGVAVPGQVARLITTATDPNNLSRLYPGWQPYL